MRTLNLGIFAHVDAGKTGLTERILFAAGAIRTPGSVDAGTTQTDSLALERERGITIRAAVASFALDDLLVNLLDTPGHPDFIAEVERALTVLDGAVLVVSAVEGVQPQTPLLMGALRRLGVPTLLFVNKIDRSGADPARTLAAVRRRLTPSAVAMGRVAGAGATNAAFEPAQDDPELREGLMTVLAEHSDEVMAAFVGDGPAGMPDQRLRRELALQTRRGLVHPVYFGSATTGAGVDALMAGVAELLPPEPGDPAAPVSGRVFKIERTSSGERGAYLRMFAGTLRIRDRVAYGDPAGARGEHEGQVTSVSVFAPGGPRSRAAVVAGEIAIIGGLARSRIGDAVGAATGSASHPFAPPMLESVVVPVDPAHRGRLHDALVQIADQDPLINLRRDDGAGEIAVSLYGEVQKEVIGETLARDYGVDVGFRATTAIHIERLAGSGEALEVLRAASHSNVMGRSSPTSTNPFIATLGLRLAPAAPGTGVSVALEVDIRLVPLHIYRTVEGFVEQMTGHVREALREGLHGWEVPDARVTVIDCGYLAGETNALDFHRVTPIVVMRALEAAGTLVCEPVATVEIETPPEWVSPLLGLLSRVGSGVRPPTSSDAGLVTLRADVAARLVDEVRRSVPGLSAGLGTVMATFGGYQPTSGMPVRRPRSTPDPRNLEDYVRQVGRRA